MPLKTVGTWILQIVPISATIGFGISKLSKDHFETNAKKIADITPHYDSLKSSMNQSFNNFSKAKDNLIRVVGSTQSPSIYDTHESLPDYIKREPYEKTLLNFAVSGHLPKKCRNLVHGLMPEFEKSVALLNEISDYYRLETFYQDTFAIQQDQLETREKSISQKITQILKYIEKDELRLTKSIRRRVWDF